MVNITFNQGLLSHIFNNIVKKHSFQLSFVHLCWQNAKICNCLNCVCVCLQVVHIRCRYVLSPEPSAHESTMVTSAAIIVCNIITPNSTFVGLYI